MQTTTKNSLSLKASHENKAKMLRNIEQGLTIGLLKPHLRVTEFNSQLQLLIPAPCQCRLWEMTSDPSTSWSPIIQVGGMINFPALNFSPSPAVALQSPGE